MQPMVTNSTRRRLLKAALASGCCLSLNAVLGCQAVSSSRTFSQQAAIVGCSRTLAGGYAVVVADQQGQPLYQVDLPARGHGVAVQKQGELAVAFARRPGHFMQLFNYRTGESAPLLSARNDRYFYGHGAFSSDGQWLYTTEGERGTSQGIIGVYRVEANKLTKVKEYTNFGIGPHEVVLVDDNTLAIGVGGVHTQGRTPLNLATMQPALVYLDAINGAILEQAVLPDKKLSIRHLSVTESGDVVCGQQYRGEPEHGAPLVAIHKRGQPLKSLIAADEEWLRFNHYIASISSLDGYLLATSPRGNCYGIWRESDRKLIEIQPLIDASGVGVINNQWLVGSGSGTVLSVSQGGRKLTSKSPVLWDNHWSVLA